MEQQFVRLAKSVIAKGRQAGLRGSFLQQGFGVQGDLGRKPGRFL